MRWFRSLWFRLQPFYRRHEIEADLTEEIQLHVEMATQERIAEGEAPGAARVAALREFGNVIQVKEAYREERSLPWLEQLIADLRYAMRQARRTPGFTVAAAVTLALGIGATTALYTVANGIWLDPFPFRDSANIYMPVLRQNHQRGGAQALAEDLPRLAAVDGVEDVMGAGWTRQSLGRGTDLEFIRVVYMSAHAFDFLGVPMALGRAIGPSDVAANGDVSPVVVLSYPAWQRLFQGNANALGQSIELNRIKYTIIGVARFRLKAADVYIPTSLRPDLQQWITPFIRLKAGVTREVMAQRLQSAYRQLAREHPERFAHDDVTVTLGTIVELGMAVGTISSSIRILFVAVVFLLLIACANVMNLQLARGATRAREIALRLSLGASRGRLFRQLLTESIGLSCLGGALGVGLAIGLTKVVMAILPPNVIPSEADTVHMNGAVLGFAVVLAILTGIVAGVVPAWQNTRGDPNSALKDGGLGAAGGARGKKLRSGLVIAEVALAVMLAVGATMTVNGFIELQKMDPGFSLEHTLSLQIPLMPGNDPSPSAQTQFARRLLDDVRSLPGVESVAVGTLPFEGRWSWFYIPGQEANDKAAISVTAISADYRRSLGMRLIKGRDLTEAESLDGSPVALVNEAAANLWQKVPDPLGRSIFLSALSATPNQDTLWLTHSKPLRVIGVVANTRNHSLREAVAPAIFIPHVLVSSGNTCLIVRTSGEPDSVLNGVRACLHALDPTRPLARPVATEEIFEEEIAQPRFTMALFATLAGLSLALAAAGIYSVISYHVSQRTREIGVRMALGALPSDIVRLVFGEGGRLLAAGLIAGGILSVAFGKIIESQVFMVATLEPWLFLVAIILLAVTVSFACYLPSRRATKVDPILALRNE